MSARLTFRDRVAAYFIAQPHVWINAVQLETIGGRQAWRTRISDCRRELGMNIENRQWVGRSRCGAFKVSEYRYVPKSDPVASDQHNANAWGLR